MTSDSSVEGGPCSSGNWKSSSCSGRDVFSEGGSCMAKVVEVAIVECSGDIRKQHQC